MKYMVARFFQDYEDLSYRIYTTDMLRITAMGQRIQSVQRYAELIDHAPKDTRSGEEIVADVVQRCGLKVKE
ncbi:MAG: hypothetical protein EOM37_11585 [Proteobacteria bacterium]|nr:hypothetical protein [Pseudomonadota bacterium]